MTVKDKAQVEVLDGYYSRQFNIPHKRYKTEAEFYKAVTQYFEDCEIYAKPLTITGLAIAIGLSRKQLIEYGNKPEHCNTVKRAKDIVQAYAEERLYTGKINPAGVIFSLKNNYGWRDEHHVTSVSRQERITYVSRLLPSGERKKTIDTADTARDAADTARDAPHVARGPDHNIIEQAP